MTCERITLPDGTTAIVTPSKNSITHTYFEPGTYTVSLTVIDTMGRIAVAAPVQVDICPPLPIDNVSDVDNDGVADDQDNCPDVANERQADLDEDGIGDLCQADVESGLAALPTHSRPALDSDRDGIEDVQDNCRSVPNPAQTDFDQDGLGDVCDHDADQDGVPEAGGPGTDNCKFLPNADQQDRDDDGDGDPCDATFDVEASAPRLIADASECTKCEPEAPASLRKESPGRVERALQGVPWLGLGAAAAVAIAGTLGAIWLLRRVK